MNWALLAAAVAFALVNGANTGATMLAATITLDSIGHVLGLLLLGLGVALGPVLVGTGVAARFAGEMVPWEGEGSETGMLVAVLVSLLVVLGLTRLGIPTGLTLAFVGAIAGYGAASGTGIAWHSVLIVLGMMALAPVLGGLLAAFVIAVFARRLRSRHVSRSLGRVHALSFPALAVGYGASDGQKMLAISAVALGLTGQGASGSVAAPTLLLVALGVLFTLGSAAGYRSMSRRLGQGVLPVRPVYAVTSEVATAAALLGSAGVGTPVGVAQTLTGSLIGAGASQGLGRVRWPQVSTIVVAWVVTLPLTFGIAAAVAGGLRAGGAL
ncbi:inorganic phosphate transporter [Ornithinicoccus hortensis]|uniref:PiT family inorganic phosphate transporter n=1 Tax=Ornithinicoccus hortensis TaxID=82346 RepID=A0A542YUY4_9MICO|nr:inorganic phosphate transporter [Ornithinicoccus hortensis]TQL51883.1 PiT family inorganic phosphate transporter [Ornithinicoccus hortensis]